MRNLVFGAVISLALFVGLSAQTYDTPGITAGGGSGSGKVLIAETVASGDASVDFDSVFDGTYDRYQIEIIGLRPATADTRLWARVRSGGSYQSGAVYDTRAYCQSSGTGSDDASFATDATAITVVGCSTSAFGLEDGAVGGAYVVLEVFEPDSASSYFQMFGRSNYTNEPSGENRSMYSRTSSIWKNAAAVTGVRFLFNSGNIASGTFRVWGLPTS